MFLVGFFIYIYIYLSWVFFLFVLFFSCFSWNSENFLGFFYATQDVDINIIRYHKYIPAMQRVNYLLPISINEESQELFKRSSPLES